MFYLHEKSVCIKNGHSVLPLSIVNDILACQPFRSFGRLNKRQTKQRYHQHTTGSNE